ncbi:hypothetical protein GobsT_27760 [Gemmata obscuriglobus]|nr:hypothetical protein GobsT_27760 [Gemmata obscuriglobus]VTS05540.1 unnamed protein product [Gemmata obscuriglobus UQM 2246]
MIKGKRAAARVLFRQEPEIGGVLLLLHGRERQPLLQRLHVIGESGRQRRGSLAPAAVRTLGAQGADGPAKVAGRGRSPVRVPVLGERIRLAGLAAAPVPIGPVVPPHEARVTTVLTTEAASPAVTAAAVPSTTRVLTDMTRLLFRSLCTVAHMTDAGSTEPCAGAAAPVLRGTVLLLAGHEAPLLSELEFVGPGGKGPPTRRGVAGPGARSDGCTG